LAQGFEVFKPRTAGGNWFWMNVCCLNPLWICVAWIEGVCELEGWFGLAEGSVISVEVVGGWGKVRACPSF
jgi:hypothetical protein